MDAKKVMEKIQEQFGSRESFLGFQLITLSMFEQPCDITFFKKKPILGVVIDPQLSLAVAYGRAALAKRTLQLLISRRAKREMVQMVRRSVK